jgi:pyridoxamine 5'-phosphate oxidase-like protein
VIPTGFLGDRERISFCTAATAPKVKALAERPNAALTIDTADAGRTTQIRGTAAIEIVDGVPPEHLSRSRPSGRAFTTSLPTVYRAS